MVDLTGGTGAEPEMLRCPQASKCDPEESTARVKAGRWHQKPSPGCAEGHGEPSAVSGTDPTLASSPTPVLLTPQLAASPTLQVPSLLLLQTPVSFQASVLPVLSS